jgi:hypothetical protein
VQEFERQASFLFTVLGGVKNLMTAPYLAQLLLRIDFNKYWSELCRTGAGATDPTGGAAAAATALPPPPPSSVVSDATAAAASQVAVKAALTAVPPALSVAEGSGRSTGLFSSLRPTGR